jgi:sugar phosphate isomerase/epimerase
MTDQTPGEVAGGQAGTQQRSEGERVGTQRLGIEHLSVFGLPPVEFVNLAADLGLHYIATGLMAFPFNPHGYSTFSLRDDAKLRREMLAAMRDRGVSISLGEGFSVRPQKDMSASTGDLDLMRELGVTRINTVGLDPDRARTFDQFGLLAEMAGARGMETTLEFGPGLTIGNLATALEAIQHVGRPDFRLLIDTMHLIRSGSTAADLAAIDPALIGYAQLSDAPMKSSTPNYMEEAMYNRMVPGEGELPLRDILAALPPDTVIGLEVPLRAQAEAGIGPQIRLQHCAAAARRLLPGI